VPNPFPSDYVFPQFGGGFNSWKPHPAPPYMLQWNLALQKQLPGDWLVSATYLGNRSLHQSFTEPFNPTVYIPLSCVAGQYGLTAAGPCSNTGNANYRGLLYLQDPVRAFALGGTSYDGDGGTANYNGLVTSVQKRFAQNYSVSVNHTGRTVWRGGGRTLMTGMRATAAAVRTSGSSSISAAWSQPHSSKVTQMMRVIGAVDVFTPTPDPILGEHRPEWPRHWHSAQ
jgi:hypothetical protein